MDSLFRAAILAASLAAAVARPQARTIEEARAVALNYSKWLPNLIATQHIQRHADGEGTGHWSAVDTLTVQVTYFERRESYTIVAQNNRARRNRPLVYAAGAVSQGEFGSWLRWIFDPAAKASFERNGSRSIRGRATSAFAYRVEAANSRLELRALSQSVFAAFHGTVWIDDANGQVLRLTAASDAPPGFPIRNSYVEIDYDWASVAGHRYLLPSRAVTGMTEQRSTLPIASPSPGGNAPPGSCISCDPPGVPSFGLSRPAITRYRNRIQFSGYREFTADSKLTFETAHFY